ncbi:Co2+/Mg2+ efflux protein ApaG [Oceanospirillum sanctuarii]|uniref:Co2+/Mg2+ efflux protein ApaG n=1 Tax=Oceanospirillum sanctuarii TaxID=1434821 RepID=UPI000A3945E2|nr:Co2+/Mg2+ efflux protein ApaG [Oceanospirillum sanctuarii]
MTDISDQDQPASAGLLDLKIEPKFIKQDTAEDRDQYVFSYKVTITNNNRTSVKLLTRSWVITDGNGKVNEVKGKGVVGQQPVIAPGESYSYTSGAIFPTPLGFMQGFYELTDIEFDCPLQLDIPAFRLAKEDMLH